MGLTDEFKIRNDERVTFIGMSGSGKTTLAKYILIEQKQVLFLDTKSTSSLPGFVNIRDDIRKSLQILRGGGNVILAPNWQNGKDYYNRLFIEIMKIKGTTLYIDEFYSVVNGSESPSTPLGAIATRGREFKIRLWGSIQRPTRVPLFLLSEAEHLFAFTMKLPTDVKRMYEIAEREFPIKALPKQSFYHIHTSAHTVSGPHRLEIGGSNG